ncbi:DNA polymerase II small subunit [Methanocaldococcus villosus KIN24-T80]|uniref:DNA polymerase II small subunit n=1 Tax=Methanocaldococcus villosus KIN24-T80 TaxID=1069083 RepID=N6V3G4_9EURY|nr:DNA-directed DNA polymerase II small subunit [Methanocaldococcus villosus]ENN96803.1 DNA polymerase II small subunit [Methanocaldococcus villosus KIN24-T80]
MINKFLEIEVLLTPDVYKALKQLKNEDIEMIIKKIKEFKRYNNKLILLDKNFLEIFTLNSLDEIINKYKDFDFISYYTGEKEEKKEEIKEEVIKEREEKEETKEEKEEVKEELPTIEEKEKTKNESLIEIRESFKSRINWIAKDIETKVKIYEDTDVSGKSTCTGSIEDFIKYFRDRYERLKKFIERKAKRKAKAIKDIRKVEEDVFTVGLVSDVSQRKNGDLLVRIEDLEDEILLILQKDKINNGELPDDILLDEVIGATGMVKNGVMYVNEIIRPSPTPKEPKRIDEEIYMCFLSDIHVGSNEFLKKDFEKFIRFLNGETNNGFEERIVSRLKYICIAGDLVDGVGVYPGQEEDLYEIDIIKQYEEIANFIEQIPEHIAIIISPGNHDAVRPAEPQPRLPDEITKLFNRDNIYFVGNPCVLNIHDFNTLLYHGRSFDDLVSQVRTASYENPTTIMKELIKRRLLCPTYGGRCPIAPEHKDYLVIDKDIDILHTGHIHINGYGIYRGIVMVNSGTFQEQTDFQKRMGIKPTPSIVPIINLSKVGQKGHYIEWDKGIVELRY